MQKQVISPTRAPPQTTPPTHVLSPMPSLQSAQIPLPEVEEPEEPTEDTSGFEGHTGEWVVRIVPPAPPPFPVVPLRVSQDEYQAFLNWQNYLNKARGEEAIRRNEMDASSGAENPGCASPETGSSQDHKGG